MRLDLLKTSKKLRKHLAVRVREYPLYINEGPGKDEAPIKQITVGFQFDQSGWLAIVFDTRPGAKADGEWNSFIEPNAIEFVEWHKAFNDLVDKRAAIRVTPPNGSKISLDERSDIEEFAEALGKTIRDVLVSGRNEGAFATLPLASECAFVVEEHGGYYGWSDREESGPTSEQSYLASLEGNVSTKTNSGRIVHWINVLERIALGEEADSEWSFLAPDLAIERLKELRSSCAGSRSAVRAEVGKRTRVCW